MSSEGGIAAGAVRTDGARRTERFEVIVHPAGRLDAEHLAHFWTEVPALSACTGNGMTVEEALARTREDIQRWLSWSRSAEVVLTGIELDMETAY